MRGGRNAATVSPWAECVSRTGSSVGGPARTDPSATIAWAGSLHPELRTDVSLKTFFGRGSGESIQMEFNGDGFVVIQPYEEAAFQIGGG